MQPPNDVEAMLELAAIFPRRLSVRRSPQRTDRLTESTTIGIWSIADLLEWRDLGSASPHRSEMDLANVGCLLAPPTWRGENWCNAAFRRRAMKRKAPAERIPVTDQVGKRHVVLRYVEVETGPTLGEHQRTTDVIEYRLEAGRSVVRTGSDTFQTADGLLKLKILES